MAPETSLDTGDTLLWPSTGSSDAGDCLPGTFCTGDTLYWPPLGEGVLRLESGNDPVDPMDPTDPWEPGREPGRLMTTVGGAGCWLGPL